MERMDFEWDNAKALRNHATHGVLFDATALVLLNHPVVRLDARKDYGEVRKVAIGTVAGSEVILIVVFTERDGTHRIISARKANKRERNKHHGHR